MSNVTGYDVGRGDTVRSTVFPVAVMCPWSWPASRRAAACEPAGPLSTTPRLIVSPVQPGGRPVGAFAGPAADALPVYPTEATSAAATRVAARQEDGRDKGGSSA